MSFWAAAGSMAVTAAGKYFGGNGNGETDYATNFSQKCGLPNRITAAQAQKYKATARATGQDRCVVAQAAEWGLPTAKPQSRHADTPHLYSMDVLKRTVPAASPGGSPLEQFVGGLATAISGTAQAGMLGGGMAAGMSLRPIATIYGIVRGAAGKILSVILPNGMKISRKAAVNLAKQIGIGAAAGYLGITAVEMAEMILTESTKPRRRRGITARDLSNARRVNCRIKSMARDLGIKTTCAPRRRTCR